MSQGNACVDRAAHRARWVVIDRQCNYSAFSGSRRTASDYSAVHCPVCGHIWRTKARYVGGLPDGRLAR
jgi:hypothetical protein